MKKMLLFLVVAHMLHAGESDFWTSVEVAQYKRPDLIPLVDRIRCNEGLLNDSGLPEKILREDVCSTWCCFGCCCPYQTDVFMEVTGKALLGMVFSEANGYSPYAQRAARHYLGNNVFMLDGQPLADHPEGKLLTGLYMKKHDMSFHRAPRPVKVKEDRCTPWEKDCPDCRYPCPPVCSLFCALPVGICMQAAECSSAARLTLIAATLSSFPLAFYHISIEEILGLRLKRKEADVSNQSHEE